MKKNNNNNKQNKNKKHNNNNKQQVGLPKDCSVILLTHSLYFRLKTKQKLFDNYNFYFIFIQFVTKTHILSYYLLPYAIHRHNYRL